MFLVVEKMGATAEDDELLLVFWRLVGGAVGEPPVLFAEDIFQNEASKIFPEVAWAKQRREAPKWQFTPVMSNYDALRKPGYRYIYLKKIVYFGGLLNL